ncbi:MAG: sensor histidine kinase [Actinomycetota bacterium]
MVPLQERAAFLEVVRVTFALMVISAAWLVPPIAGDHRVPIVLISVAYIVIGAAPHTLTRLSRPRVLGLLQAALLTDGLYVAWVLLATGGTESPFRFFIYVHIIAVTLAASYRTGLKIALWHTLLYLLLFRAAVGGFLPRADGPFADGAAQGSASALVIFLRVCGFWMVALTAAAFSALNERELRMQKIDLQLLSEWVAGAAQLTSTDDIADSLLGSLQATYGFARGAVLASPKDDLKLVGALGITDPGAIDPGLDAVVSRAWATRDVVAVAKLDPASDPRLAALMPDAENVLVVPMFADRGYRVGVVVLEHPGHRRIKRWIVTMVRQFTTHAGMGLHGTWLMETIQEQLSEIRGLKDRVVAQNLSLESRVAEQTQELRTMVKELQAVDAHRRDLLAHIVRAQEEERERIAGDIHDDPVQRVVVLGMRLQLLRRELTDPGQLQMVDELLESVQACTRGMRHLLFELRPPVLDEQGLGAALREYLEQRQPDFTYRIDDRLDSRPSSPSLIVAYRIAQEALANVIKHAQATELLVALHEQDGGLLVQIQDDGVGFEGEIPRVSAPGHMGISSMRERAELQGGWCELSSLPEGGAAVRFWIPGLSQDAPTGDPGGQSTASRDAPVPAGWAGARPSHPRSGRPACRLQRRCGVMRVTERAEGTRRRVHHSPTGIRRRAPDAARGDGMCGEFDGRRAHGLAGHERLPRLRPALLRTGRHDRRHRGRRPDRGNRGA